MPIHQKQPASAFPYKPLYTQTFLDCLKKHKDKKGLIVKLVQRILGNPKAGSHHLENKKGINLYCRHSRHLNPNFVMVFHILEQEKQIVFLAFGKHDVAYSKEWPIKTASNPPFLP
ncbi:MAG: hypothetical protein HY747_09695 [Elusimicrobia bacterium]|nr:hypothetical protein [Elusimicrobiota bacterium]